jgi:[protein-PII] uridylyltransferase
VPPRVLIDNTASATHTVIEVNGRDRPGLLYDVTRGLTDLGLQISTAKISTFGERVVDVFYVKDVFGVKIEHQRKIEDIRARLYEALAEPRAEGAPAASGAAESKQPAKGAESPAAE